MAAVSLNYQVFMHSYAGFNSTSTLFYGERDAILVDATQLLSDAHRLAADLILAGKNLTHIYVSHFHPDHHFGVGVLKSAFPRAHVVALPSVVKDIVFTTNDKVEMWGDFFGKNEPETLTFPMPLSEPRLEVEGHALEFSDDWDGDSANNSVVWGALTESRVRHGRRISRLSCLDDRKQPGASPKMARLPQEAL